MEYPKIPWFIIIIIIIVIIVIIIIIYLSNGNLKGIPHLQPHPNQYRYNLWKSHIRYFLNISDSKTSPNPQIVAPNTCTSFTSFTSSSLSWGPSSSGPHSDTLLVEPLVKRQICSYCFQELVSGCVRDQDRSHRKNSSCKVYIHRNIYKYIYVVMLCIYIYIF